MTPAARITRRPISFRPGGLVLQKFWRVAVNDRAWVQHIIPVTSYAGQTVQVYFNAYNDGSGNLAGMYLDDVHLWACPSQVRPARQCSRARRRCRRQPLRRHRRRR